MANAIIRVPEPSNEPVRTYSPGSNEKASLKRALENMMSESIEIPVLVGGEEIRTGALEKSICPHDHGHVLATVHQAGSEEVNRAVEASRLAWSEWSELDWESRSAVFFRAAELLAGPWRDTINAATMLNQSKNVYQAEIDSAAELIDFWRFNAHFMRRIYEEQPNSVPGMWNFVENRALEGFVFAVTPFNFTSIAGNLPTAPALMGNTVLWKPASTSVLSGYYIMKLLEEAGLPPGVVNFLPGRGSTVGDPVMARPELAGIHFTGSTRVFQAMWRQIGANIADYHTYPRIVGETGGKDFIFAHPSADVAALVTALVRGAYEYQGQKCSAASRAFIPRSIWNEVRERFIAEVETLSMGSPLDFRNFMCAVIDENSFDNAMRYIDFAKSHDGLELICGGEGDKSSGYFVQPTAVLSEDPRSKLMCEEIFAPVLTFYVYEDKEIEQALIDCDQGSPYG
ncbi:MAG: L-glutamate gamma-semialdehyde dehydrogenase, partial [Acidobacteriota bacterium]